jgi:exodeoxyribonuclease III
LSAVTVATWNVNSIKARLPNVLDWLRAAKPDIVLLQELKTVEEGFPALELGDLGYNCAVSGQKTYNGVAILAKTALDVQERRLPGDDKDEQARYIEAVTTTDAGTLRVASVYLPNGNPLGTEKFAYKLAWLARLEAHARRLLALEEPVILAGDYNVIPEDIDCHDPAAWTGDALFQPESRAGFRRLLHLGYWDAFRALHPDAAGAYSYWDYQGGAWAKDHGIRIDHLLLSPQAADLLDGAGIDRAPRGREKASDHTPAWCRLARRSAG